MQCVAKMLKEHKLTIKVDWTFDDLVRKLKKDSDFGSIPGPHREGACEFIFQTKFCWDNNFFDSIFFFKLFQNTFLPKICWWRHHGGLM